MGMTDERGLSKFRIYDQIPPSIYMCRLGGPCRFGHQGLGLLAFEYESASGGPAGVLEWTLVENKNGIGRSIEGYSREILTLGPRVALVGIVLSLILLKWVSPHSSSKRKWLALCLIGVAPVMLAKLLPEPQILILWAPYFFRAQALLVFSWATYLTQSIYLTTVLSLILGSGIGNSVNQWILHGQVTDFIWLPFLDWYIGIANIADFVYSISLGMLLLYPLLRLMTKRVSTTFAD
jgi:hypothetical protein